MHNSLREDELMPNRRQFLAGASLGAASLAMPRWVSAVRGAEVGLVPPGSLPSGLITREREPMNLEFPFATLDKIHTPNNQFFVRTHFPIPSIDSKSFRLKCSGHVDHEASLSYDEIRKLPQKTVTATLECAGNSRVFLVPRARGVLWELGAVSTAAWTGVPLSAVLERAGVKSGAVDVILHGADKGSINDDPKSPGEIHFSRSITLEKARQPEVLLAYQMNGEDLTPEHGFPLRAVVPGWYGVASIKWLTHIEVTGRPFAGFWQTTEYSYWKRDMGEPVAVPVREMQVKSEIARPMRGERILRAQPYRVYGAAWSDGAEVAKVEVSTDGGKNWQQAKLLGEPVPFTWRLWELEWQAPQSPGRVTLMSRAADAKGRQQASAHSPDRKAYMISHTLPIDVEIG
jgi:DMSO/TMAO reductase YedYZ molybdopterin-dependent catalytic subunit